MGGTIPQHLRAGKPVRGQKVLRMRWVTERRGTASEALTPGADDGDGGVVAVQPRATERKGRTRGNLAVDVFRGLVVVLMFAVHARRIQAGKAAGALEGAADASLRFLMRIEPYIAASFLYLVGVSLVLSWSSACASTPEVDRPSLARRWRGRMLRRAGWLYLLSVGLCLPQFGLQWPATFVSSGILSVIALAIVVCATLLSVPGGRRLAWPLATLVLLVTSVLHVAQLGVSGLNAGPGGTFPLLAASVLGVLSAPDPLGSKELRSAWQIVCLAIAGFEVARAFPPALTDTFTSRYRDYGDLAAQFWLENGPTLPERWRDEGFWNHTSLGLLACLLAIWLTHQLLHSVFNSRATRSEPARSRPTPSGSTSAQATFRYKPFVLTALGEHALVAYITHLIALGLVEMFGLAPTSSIGTWCLVALLVVLSLVSSSLVNGVFRRRLETK